jgi:hypothetical protein
MKRLVPILFFVLSGCMSVTLSLSPKWDSESKPVYEDYVDYWWWGLRGKPRLNLQKICVDQKPYAVRRLKSGEDIFITFVTLGIYTPSTVRVWCGD